MLDLIYLALDKRITETVGNGIYTDWYLGQYIEAEMEGGGERLFDTPCVLVEFSPIAWKTLGNNRQQATVTVQLHVVTESHDTDHQRITNAVPGHLALEGAVYRAVQGWSGRLSYVPGHEATEDTANDACILNTMVRIGTTPDHSLSRHIVTVLTFQTLVVDNTANMPMAEAAATWIVNTNIAP